MKEELPNVEDPDILSVLQNKVKAPAKAPRVETRMEASDGGDENTTYLEGLKLHLVAGGLILVGFLVALNASVVVTVSVTFPSLFWPVIPLMTSDQAIPRITSDFHSIEDIGWYGSAYLLV
jgi:hypothetical protein